MVVSSAAPPSGYRPMATPPSPRAAVLPPALSVAHRRVVSRDSTAAAVDSASIEAMLADIDNTLQRARGASTMHSTPSSVSPGEPMHGEPLPLYAAHELVARPALRRSTSRSPPRTPIPGFLVSPTSPGGRVAFPDFSVGLDASVAAANRLSATFSPDAARCVNHAHALLGSGSWSAASIFATGTLIRRWPQMAEGYYVAAFAAMKLRDFNEAVSHFGTCIDILSTAVDGGTTLRIDQVMAMQRQARKAQRVHAVTTDQQERKPGAITALLRGAAALIWRVVWVKVPLVLVLVPLAFLLVLLHPQYFDADTAAMMSLPCTTADGAAHEHPAAMSVAMDWLTSPLRDWW
jgi:hypothetical protein